MSMDVYRPREIVEGAKQRLWGICLLGQLDRGLQLVLATRSPRSPRAVPTVASASARIASSPSSVAMRTASSPDSTASLHSPPSIWNRAACESARACAAESGRSRTNSTARSTCLLTPGASPVSNAIWARNALGLRSCLHVACLHEHFRRFAEAFCRRWVRERRERVAQAKEQMPALLVSERSRARGDRNPQRPDRR